MIITELLIDYFTELMNEFSTDRLFYWITSWVYYLMIIY
jgi:hypothetical protein